MEDKNERVLAYKTATIITQQDFEKISEGLNLHHFIHHESPSINTGDAGLDCIGGLNLAKRMFK